MAIYDFHDCHQEPEEYVDDFSLLSIPSSLTVTSETSQRNLMLQLIEGCGHRKAQLELLAMRDLRI